MSLTNDARNAKLARVVLSFDYICLIAFNRANMLCISQCTKSWKYAGDNKINVLQENASGNKMM